MKDKILGIIKELGNTTVTIGKFSVSKLAIVGTCAAVGATSVAGVGGYAVYNYIVDNSSEPSVKDDVANYYAKKDADDRKRAEDTAKKTDEEMGVKEEEEEEKTEEVVESEGITQSEDGSFVDKDGNKLIENADGTLTTASGTVVKKETLTTAVNKVTSSGSSSNSGGQASSGSSSNSGSSNSGSTSNSGNAGSSSGGNVTPVPTPQPQPTPQPEPTPQPTPEPTPVVKPSYWDDNLAAQIVKKMGRWDVNSDNYLEAPHKQWADSQCQAWVNGSISASTLSANLANTEFAFCDWTQKMEKNGIGYVEVKSGNLDEIYYALKGKGCNYMNYVFCRVYYDGNSDVYKVWCVTGAPE